MWWYIERVQSIEYDYICDGTKKMFLSVSVQVIVEW